MSYNPQPKKISVELKGWQREGYKLVDENGNGNIFVFKSARQRGKSYFIAIRMLSDAINHKGSTSIYVAPTLTQSRKLYKDVVNMLGNIPVLDSCNGSLLEITFKNGSQLYFKSAEQGEGLRGFTCKGDGELFIDEAAFIQNDIFSLIFPYVSVSRANIIMCSTPLWREGIFYDLYSKGLEGKSDNIFAFDITKYDNSFFISDEQKKQFFDTMPLRMYLSEIEGQFIDNQSSVFGEFSKVCSNDFKYGNKRYLAVDFGSGNGQDNTALVVMNDLKQMIDLQYFNDCTAQETVKRIVETADKYNVCKIVVEKNGIGNVFLDLLTKELHGRHNLQTFVTTNESKQRIINQLTLAIEKDEIQLLDNIELKIELTNYEVENTRSGKITFNARHGYKDDCVMATAICLNEVIRDVKNEGIWFI